ncbi:macrolide-efflux transmembrane protein [Thermus parvatiensis]|uniref:Macrolide-efflux transmembrane protein n=1 Tax=Thermus parvatiensis TaxID=456163 RepID=H7GEX4_9DEIN|nr:MFS transporter [Thermus parvatiensis]EIA39721.1 macrolide-efflux transmembrane protein [Thermus parvatiensis]
MAVTVLPAMVLAKTGMSEAALALVRSVAGLGGVVGRLLLSVWGGPKKRVHGVFLGMAFSSLALALMGVAEGPGAWATLAFLESLFIPIINGSNQAIWQAKVPPSVQGKVFAARRMIAWYQPLGDGPWLAPWRTGSSPPQYGQGEGIAPHAPPLREPGGCFGGFPATSSLRCGKRNASFPDAKENQAAAP